MRILIFQLVALGLIGFVNTGLSFARTSPQQDTFGEQRTAVILINSSERTITELPSPAEIHESVFDGEFSANAFFQSVSYGKTHLKGDVVGWLNHPELSTACILPPEKLFPILNSEIRFKNYDRFVVFYSLNATLCENQSLGFSTHGKEVYQTPQGKIRASISNIGIDHILAKPVLPYQRLSGVASGVMIHELGHGFGVLGHANVLHCGKKVFSENAEDCTQSAIADVFSIMGGEGFFRPSVSMNACHQEALGWLDSPQLFRTSVQELQSAPRDINLYPSETKRGASVLAVRIDLDKPIPITKGVALTRLYLEYKTPVGLNRRLADLNQRPQEIFKNIQFVGDEYKDRPGFGIDIQGLQIRGGLIRSGRCVTTYLMDTSPGSIQWGEQRYDLYDVLDGFLKPGASVYEPRNRLVLENRGMRQDGSLRIRLSVR